MLGENETYYLKCWSDGDLPWCKVKNRLQQIQHIDWFMTEVPKKMVISYFLLKRLVYIYYQTLIGTLSTDPYVSCDPAIRYSGLFGVHSVGPVPLEIFLDSFQFFIGFLDGESKY